MSTIEQLKREELASLQGQRSYAVDCLMNRINEMEDFEVKEFTNMVSNYNSEISFLENHIKNVF